MATPNRATLRDRDTQILRGIDEHLSKVPSFALAGAIYTRKELIGMLQQRIDSANACTAARAALHEAVDEHRGIDKSVRKIIQALRAHLLNVYGEQAGILGDFGFAPPKRSKPSVETLAMASEKRRATRLARGTKGRRQRLEIKGTLSEPPHGTTSGATSSNGAAANGAAHAA